MAFMRSMKLAFESSFSFSFSDGRLPSPTLEHSQCAACQESYSQRAQLSEPVELLSKLEVAVGFDVVAHPLGRGVEAPASSLSSVSIAVVVAIAIPSFSIAAVQLVAPPAAAALAIVPLCAALDAARKDSVAMHKNAQLGHSRQANTKQVSKLVCNAGWFHTSSASSAVAAVAIIAVAV